MTELLGQLSREENALQCHPRLAENESGRLAFSIVTAGSKAMDAAIFGLETGARSPVQSLVHRGSHLFWRARFRGFLKNKKDAELFDLVRVAEIMQKWNAMARHDVMALAEAVT
jgi:hypothetical protein